MLFYCVLLYSVVSFYLRAFGMLFLIEGGGWEVSYKLVAVQWCLISYGAALLFSPLSFFGWCRGPCSQACFLSFYQVLGNNGITSYREAHLEDASFTDAHHIGRVCLTSLLIQEEDFLSTVDPSLTCKRAERGRWHLTRHPFAECALH